MSINGKYSREERIIAKRIRDAKQSQLRYYKIWHELDFKIKIAEQNLEEIMNIRKMRFKR